MAEGVGFPFPSLPLNEGLTYGQPEVVLISLPQVATGLRLHARQLNEQIQLKAFHLLVFLKIYLPKEVVEKVRSFLIPISKWR